MTDGLVLCQPGGGAARHRFHFSPQHWRKCVEDLKKNLEFKKIFGKKVSLVLFFLVFPFRWSCTCINILKPLQMRKTQHVTQLKILDCLYQVYRKIQHRHTSYITTGKHQIDTLVPASHSQVCLSGMCYHEQSDTAKRYWGGRGCLQQAVADKLDTDIFAIMTFFA